MKGGWIKQPDASSASLSASLGSIAGLLRERSRNNCGHGTKFGDFPTVCGHFLASKAGKDAIVAWPQKKVVFFGAKCVGWANLCQTVGFWWLVILVIPKSLCVCWFWRVAISPLLYSVSFNSKAPLVIWSHSVENCHGVLTNPKVVSGINDPGGDSMIISSRGCSMNDLAAMIFTVWRHRWMPFHWNLVPCHTRLVCTWKWMGFSLAFWRQKQMLTPDVLWLQVRSAQLRLLNTVSPALRTRKHNTSWMFLWIKQSWCQHEYRERTAPSYPSFNKL